MGLRFLKYLLLGFVLVLTASIAKAQTGLCPTNFDFENGDFTDWICRTGTVRLTGGVNTITWTGTGPVAGRHTIISAADQGFDMYGGFPLLCPNGSGYSVKLGNNQTGAQAEALSFSYTIPSTLTTFSILFNYAVVLEDPSHSIEEQPRFRARIIDQSTSTPLPCVTFDFAASSSLPGFRPSSLSPIVLYKDWTAVSINLNEYIGKTISLEFITSDCTAGGHFGYAYMDVNTACNGAIKGSTICAGDTAITLTAPYGFSSYRWYPDNTFSSIISNTQTLTLNPLPAVGSVYPVIVEPFAGFGCPDTLYATVTISPKPAFEAGADANLCKYQQIQLGGASTIGYQYAWTPANKVSNSIISNPVVSWENSATPTEFFVKTTDILTGCYSYDSVIITSKLVDTSISLNGKSSYCIGDTDPGVLTANNTSTAVQWYNDNTLIAGATSVSYRPSANGNYWASVTQDGCTDSTSKYSIAIYPIPQTVFSPVLDSGCVATNSFQFTNSSSVSDGSPLSYLWKFSDGDRHQTADVTKTFTTLGIQTVELVTSTAFGCKDSTTGKIHILPNGIPDFSIDSICLNRPVLFTNSSIESGWPKVDYSWDFDNGGANSSLKDPPSVTYTTEGRANVKLTMTIEGCENDPQSITKLLFVNNPAKGVRYRTITVPEKHIWPIQIRDTIGTIYNWRPRVHLSNYSSPNTNFYADGDDVEYLIDITDPHTCVTTDTIQMLVLKKPGYYLPTAFTPNGDGRNDLAVPYLVGMKSLKSFSVYNRWGNLVYFTKTEKTGWDGKHNGVDQPGDVYIWILEFITEDDKVITEKGSIMIIR